MLAAEHVAKRVSDKPVWIEGVGWQLDTAYWTNRDLAYPRYVEYAARAWPTRWPASPSRDNEIHIAEPYDPFDYKALHHLEGLHAGRSGQGAAAVRRRHRRPRRRHAGLPVRRACSASATRSPPPA